MTDNDQLQMALFNEPHNNVISLAIAATADFLAVCTKKVRRILKLNLGFRYQKQDAANLQLRFYIVALPGIQ